MLWVSLVILDAYLVHYNTFIMQISTLRTTPEAAPRGMPRGKGPFRVNLPLWVLITPKLNTDPHSRAGD